MGYSRENERQNKVLGDLIKGKAPEKRVMVGYEGNKEPAKHGDIISPLSDIMQLKLENVCTKIESIAFLRYFSPLKTGMPIVTNELLFLSIFVSIYF